MRPKVASDFAAFSSTDTFITDLINKHFTVGLRNFLSNGGHYGYVRGNAVCLCS